MAEYLRNNFKFNKSERKSEAETNNILNKVIKQGIPTVRKTAQNYADAGGPNFVRELDSDEYGSTNSKLIVVNLLITRIKLEWGDNATTLQRAIEYYNWEPPSRGRWTETGATARKTAIASAKADKREVYKTNTPLARQAHIIVVDTDIFNAAEVEELRARLGEIEWLGKSGERNIELYYGVHAIVNPGQAALDQEAMKREVEAAKAEFEEVSPMHESSHGDESSHGGRRKSTRRSRRRRRHRSTRSRRRRHRSTRSRRRRTSRR